MRFKNYVNIGKQHLTEYSYSVGGGMTGGYYEETVKKMEDGKALISVKKADWYYKDPEVKEYLVDGSVMDELENIFRKNHMNFWHRKKFTNLFIADGESKSYDFDFEKSFVGFSSQIYPTRYRDKLKKLDEVVNSYIEKSEKLPGLVLKNNWDNGEGAFTLPENELFMYISYYCNNYLEVRFLNGTETDTEISGNCKIVNTDNEMTVYEKELYYDVSVYKRSRTETHIELDTRLSAGNYIMYIGEYELPFEIR